MPKGVALLLIVAVAISATSWVLWRKLRPSKVYVIGEQMARARRAEQARLSSSKAGPSPLPANLHYDSSRGDLDLSDPPKHPLDDELSSICHRFALNDQAGRSRLRDSASMDDFYTLLSFSRRSAVFAEANHRLARLCAS